jgi:hypothetical protein
MILAVGEVLMELRRVESDGAVAVPGNWQGPFCSGAPAIFASAAAAMIADNYRRTIELDTSATQAA